MVAEIASGQEQTVALGDIIPTDVDVAWPYVVVDTAADESRTTRGRALIVDFGGTSPQPAQLPVVGKAVAVPAANLGDVVILSVDAVWQGVEQTIVLYEDGRLVVGGLEARAEIPTLNSYWIDQQAEIMVIDFGAADYDQAILVSLPIDELEDPPNRSQLFVEDDGVLRRILDRAFGVYNVTPLTFVGDGTVEYQEDRWSACLRAEMPAEANRQIVTLALDDSGMLVEAARRDSGDVQACDRLAG